jgi:predicted nucleic acid-binding protein
VIFDTDVFIWIQHGNVKAANMVNRAERRCISVHTYMEFLHGSQDKQHLRRNQEFLRDLSFETLPITENIAHRASIYVEQYVLSHSMRAGDALIAATAAEYGLTLVTSNAKQFRQIQEIQLKIFRP